LVCVPSLKKAQQQGVQQAMAWWPKDTGYVSWGVKAWHVGSAWFRREVQDVIELGLLTTNKMQEDTYASAA
jgi:hypothetical protein